MRARTRVRLRVRGNIFLPYIFIPLETRTEIRARAETTIITTVTTTVTTTVKMTTITTELLVQHKPPQSW